jgi:hypothetical protein
MTQNAVLRASLCELVGVGNSYSALFGCLLSRRAILLERRNPMRNINSVIDGKIEDPQWPGPQDTATDLLGAHANEVLVALLAQRLASSNFHGDAGWQDLRDDAWNYGKLLMNYATEIYESAHGNGAA